MAKVPRADPFDSKTVEALLFAVRVEPRTAKAESFLRGLRSAVELYRDLFPDGRPNADREVTVRRKLLGLGLRLLRSEQRPLLLDRADRAGMPGGAGRARVAHRWAVVVAEQRSFSKVGRLSSQLVDQLAGLSRDAKVALTDQLFLEFSGRLRVGDLVNVLAALKAACEEFSKGDTRRTPRAHRNDIQLLVDCVVPIFADHYTKWEEERRHRAKASSHANRTKASSYIRALLMGDIGTTVTRALLMGDIGTVLQECSSAAGVKAKLDLTGERACRDYVVPSLKQLLKQHRHKALRGLLVRIRPHKVVRGFVVWIGPRCGKPRRIT